MTLFFFVSLKLKRELVLGESRDLRMAALPFAGALGDMVVPVSLTLRTPPKANACKCPPSGSGVFRIEEIAAFAARISARGEIDMTTPRLTSLTLIAAALAASLALQACNTTAGIGRDVSAGADAVTDSAEKNKGY